MTAETFNKELERLEGNGATSKLWIQYYKMISLVRLFIQAERICDWNLHLQCVRHMIPLFHAAGHLHYAKAAHLYLQEMVELEDKLTPFEYEEFVEKGYFSIRRSVKAWAGIWSHMTIEQTLMRSMKTHGRRVSPFTLSLIHI